MKKVVFLFLSICFFHNLEAQVEENDSEKIFSIFFGGGSYYIDGMQKEELDLFLQEISDFNGYEIEIHGHTDNIGGKEYNQWLSYMRSQQVLHQLLLNNIPSEKVQVFDFGEMSPVYSNKTFKGKLHNRRVDVYIRKLAS